MDFGGLAAEAQEKAVKFLKLSRLSSVCGDLTRALLEKQVESGHRFM
jgi:hypothetical protein